MSAWDSQGANTRTLLILAFSATVGALVEFYDFFIYGYAAASAFPAIFFPRLPPTQAMVFSYLAFGAVLAEFGAERRSRAFWMSLANIGIPLRAKPAM